MGKRRGNQETKQKRKQQSCTEIGRKKMYHCDNDGKAARRTRQEMIKWRKWRKWETEGGSKQKKADKRLGREVILNHEKNRKSNECIDPLRQISRILRQALLDRKSSSLEVPTDSRGERRIGIGQCFPTVLVPQTGIRTPRQEILEAGRIVLSNEMMQSCFPVLVSEIHVLREGRSGEQDISGRAVWIAGCLQEKGAHFFFFISSSSF